jgi:hypothetical protein
MRKNRRMTPLAAAVAVALLLIAPAAAPAQDVVSGDEEGSDVAIRPGDLVTASGRHDALLRIRPRNKGRSYRLSKIPLGVRIKPKGVAHSSFCERVAIANSSNVVIFDTWARSVEVIEDHRFGLIADVEWDMQCNLIIADMGGDSVGKTPRDGKLWMYRTDGALVTIAWRRSWSNPAFLDMDEWGTLFVVDKNAGKPMRGTDGQWHFDAIYKVGGPRYTQPKERYNRSGLQVTAFAAQPDGSLLVGNGDTLLRVDKTTAWPICSGSPFRRINGVDLNSDRQIFIVDGYDVFEDTFVYRVRDDYTCALEPLAEGKMVQGAQGLAIGLPRR